MKRVIRTVLLCSLLSNLAYGQERPVVPPPQQAPPPPQQQVPPPPPPPQTQEIPPYLKYPKLPAFNILGLDSTTIFNTYNIPKGKPVAIVFFDPDCKHCKAFTEAMTKGMDSLENVRFYMITSNHNFANLREFYEKYELKKFKNIEVVGRDYEFFFLTYYAARSLPVVVIYDRDKQLVTLLDNVKSVADVYAVTSKLK